LKNINVKGSIRLDQFLKWAGVAGSGGQVKVIIQSGLVRVNGEKIISRGRVLTEGDEVRAGDYGIFRVVYRSGEKE